MASFTKDELRVRLTNHGVELPASSAKKEELVALYEEYVEPLERSKGEFSSDDEEVVLASKTKKTSRKSGTPGKTSAPATDKSQIIIEEVLSEENVDDLSQLTDDQLAARLRQHGVDVGPIVETTRPLYEKKLAKLLFDTSTTTANDDSVTNGASDAENGNHLKNGEFSADEEATEDDEEVQPSVIVRKAATPVKRTSTRTPTKAKNSSVISPLQDIGTSLRQRFAGGSDDVPDSGRGGRFTPTPRRSIHSFKITETTTQTMFKSPDGQIAHDFAYKKETSESTSEVGGGKAFLRFLPKFFFLLILVAVSYYVYTTYIPQLAAGDNQAAVEESAGASEVPVQEEIREPAPDQASISDI